MVVPRSAVEVASDDVFTLFVVSIFRRVKDEFSQRCREEKCVAAAPTGADRPGSPCATSSSTRRPSSSSARSRSSSSDKRRISGCVRARRWCILTGQADLLRLSRINFSEAVQLLIHLKVVRAFVECVLRYGLPAHYFFAFVKVRCVLLPLAMRWLPLRGLRSGACAGFS